MLYFYVAAQNAATRSAQKGAGMAEYALLLALIAAVCIAAFTTLGGSIKTIATDLAALIKVPA